MCLLLSYNTIDFMRNFGENPFATPKAESEAEREKRLPKLRGIDFSASEIREAIEADKPLQISLAFPRRKCNLKCCYCYTTEHVEGDRSIQSERALELLSDAETLGAKNVLLPGYGEPFLNKEIWPVLDRAAALGLHVVIFTNGAVLDHEKIERLKKYPVTLVFKCNSIDPGKEDKIAGVKNYTVKRNKALQEAIDAGFNKPDENGDVHLGISTMVYKDNVADVI